MLVKNQILTVPVQDMDRDGQGIAKPDGFVLFIPGALPGDIAQVKVLKVTTRSAYGKLLSLNKPSPDRVQAPCACADACGGCGLQAYAYPAQLLWKQKWVTDCLRRIGRMENVCVPPLFGMENPYAYRNKAQFVVGETAKGLSAGFYQKGSHTLIPLKSCLVHPPFHQTILREILSFCQEYKLAAYDEARHTGLVRHVMTRSADNGQAWMVCLVINGMSLPHADHFIERLSRHTAIKSLYINENREKTNVVLGARNRLLWGEAQLEEELCGLRFALSPHSFFQVNPTQTKRLYETVCAFADVRDTDMVWDLYCGIGSIGLTLARDARAVVGIESVAQAVEDARQNAVRNHIGNASFLLGKAEEILPALVAQGQTADVAVVDPPRKGCDPALLDALVKASPRRIVYVSCDPATLARDLLYVCASGYEVREIQPVDMFPHTTHVETVALLQRENA